MMRRGIRNFCNGDGSTSTLNQEKPLTTTTTTTADEDEDEDEDDLFLSSSCSNKPPTLEEMIRQLEMEEEIIARRKSKKRNPNSSSDILRSARNQYPRFSLDGKDALYQNFDQTPAPARHSVCCSDVGRERRLLLGNYNSSSTSHTKFKDVKLGMPARLAGGESVVWCNPGVIGKLMGLDAMPIPINNNAIRIQQRSFQRLNNNNNSNKLDDDRSGRRPINYNRRMPLLSSSSSSSIKNRNCIKNRYNSLN